MIESQFLKAEQDFDSNEWLELQRLLGGCSKTWEKTALIMAISMGVERTEGFKGQMSENRKIQQCHWRSHIVHYWKEPKMKI